MLAAVLLVRLAVQRLASLNWLLEPMARAGRPPSRDQNVLESQKQRQNLDTVVSGCCVNWSIPVLEGDKISPTRFYEAENGRLVNNLVHGGGSYLSY